MKKIISISFFLVISFSGFAQNNDTIDNKFCLKTPPLSLIDFYGGSSYRLGAEFKIYRNISFNLEGGKYIPVSFFYKNTNGSIFKTELKYYLNNEGWTLGTFLSLEYIYKEQSYDNSDTIRQVTPRYFKNYKVSKYVTCFNVKFGDTKFFYRRFIFEEFVGLGIRFKNAVSGLTKQEFNNIGDNEQRGGIGEYYNNQPGKFTEFNITAGIKIGFSFK